MRKSLMLSRMKHLILLVLFNVLLFNCGYVQARPNATTNLQFAPDEIKNVRELH